MKLNICLVWLCLFIWYAYSIQSTNMYTITDQYGYPLESYYVTTPDGYILRLFRINHRDRTQNNEDRPVVLMHHGATAASEDFISHGPDLSPAFYLVQNGYDVWLCNSRGNRYSRNHTTLDPDTDPEYWRFTLSEMAYDLQTVIDYILNSTSVQSLAYVTFSQSTTIGFIALSANNSWFEGRMNWFIPLAPEVRLDYITSPLYLALFNSPILYPTLRRLGINEFPADFFSTTTSTVVCGIFPNLWNLLQTYQTEGNYSVDDLDSVRVYRSHSPAGVAIGPLEQGSQVYLARRFQYFDYGYEENLLHYNSTTPPQIDISLIRNIPIAVFNGVYDLISDVRDVEWLVQQISNVLVAHNVYEYGHMTFLLGRNMTYLDDLLEIIDEYA